MRKEKGKGRAMREAVNHAVADIVVFIDGDGTYPAVDIGSLVLPLLEDRTYMVCCRSEKTFNELVPFSDKFEIEPEITVEALARGHRILEVPVAYRIRKGSKAKLDPINDGT